MRLTAFLTAATVLAALPASADGISGTFQTAPNDDGNYGHVRFAPCGAAFCGTLVASFDKSGAPMQVDSLGRNIVWDMQDQGGGKFGKGQIWDPGADRTYRSKMVLEGDTLNVSGCVGPICRKNTWTRID